MTIVPKFDRVLIRRESLQKKNSLIVIPEQISKSNQPAKGEVIAVGPTAGVWKDGEKIESVKIGEKVIFARHSGVAIELDGEEDFWIVQDNDILVSIIEDDPKIARSW